MDVRASHNSPQDELAELRRENENLRAQLSAQHDAAVDYRCLFELHPEAHWIAEPDGRLLVFNRRWSDLSGFIGEQSLSASWLELLHPEDLPRFSQAWNHAVRTGQPFDVEHRIRIPGGSHRWMRTRAFPRRSPEGVILRWYGATEDVDRQHFAEERWREDEQRLRQLRQQWQTFETALSHTPDFTYIFDLEGRFTYVNTALLSLWQKPLEDAVGKNFFDLNYPPDLAARLQRQIQQVIDTGKPLRDQTPYTGAAGEMRYYEYIFVPVLDSERRIAAVTGSTRDITPFKLSESERARAQEQLQMVIDNVPGLVSYLDLEGRYTFANRRYQDWFESGPLVGRTVADVVGEEAFRRSWPHLQRALAGETVSFEEFLPYESGRPRYVHVTYTPEYAPEGSVRGVVTMVQDITPQKQLEAALRHSEERLQQVFAQAPVAVAVLRGSELIFDLANPTYLQFFPGRELLGRPLLEAVPEVSDAILAILKRVLDSGEPFIGHEYFLPLDRDHDGVVEDCWFTFVYQPLREIDGAITGVVVVAVDVTSHVRSRHELERVNRELEEFAYVTSHDLQEPLRMVNIYSELLLKRFPGQQPEAEKYAAFIRRGVIRMETLIRDLLTYSRTVQRDELLVGVADLPAALAEAQSVLRNRVEELNAQVSSDPLPPVRGDTHQMAHVFQNLLSNALKYHRQNVTPTVSITATRSNGNWIIAVTDNGIGFEQQYAERIFGLFKRLHRDEYPGTGLGLAICQRIVERYGGRIWAEGRPGEGATFFLTLPAADA